MSSRWVLAVGMVLWPLAAVGQVAPLRISAFECGLTPDRPTELPPLLPVPSADASPPRSPSPRGPAGEYDHGYLYLPERAPPGPAPPPAACGPAGRFWFAATLELGWTAPARVPALVRLGGVDSPAVYGERRVSVPFRAGLGLAGGVWGDPARTRGVDASFYSLGRAVNADVNYRHNLLCDDRLRLDALAGYRFASVRETADLLGTSADPAGNVVQFRDTASAANRFHGGQVGLAGECRLDRWYLGLTGKVAFGTVFTETELDGKYRMNADAYPFGFFARPTVTGRRESDRFAVMPAAGVAVGRQFGEHARVFLGYQFQYLSAVVRPGDVIDPAPEAFGPGLRTRREATESDFWAQSVNLGAEFRY